MMRAPGFEPGFEAWEAYGFKIIISVLVRQPDLLNL